MTTTRPAFERPAALLIALAASFAGAPARATPHAPRPADATGCLASAIYHEAAREPLAGQEAVAAVVLNRVATRGFPKSVCAVVFEGAERRTGCQFSFTCDGSLRRTPDAELWRGAVEVARVALADPIAAVATITATDYHADYVRPYWASAHVEVARIGRHIFYTRGVRAASADARAATGGGLPGVFSAWGIAIARLTPTAGGVRVDTPTSLTD